ncbi:MAG TPA: dephospho-CoA kinase [Anaerolineae bacterium]|nr:dephospho-CoA kinase [Anaerolineae bacterium]HOR00037.1 dephospho-CoA kinase [Anaerolineae bacterium]HPL27421.1 dephospho-CoA kinase [Anaerolineae bacterium]
MYIIGLTGNIATGKSTVARILNELGAEVIDADLVAHSVVAPGSAAWAAIRDSFGPTVIAADGTVDRRRLGAMVFADPAALARLEAIVHPAVGRALVRQLAELRRGPTPPRVVVIEAIKLIEGGLTRLCDAVWLVVAPREVQMARLLQTRGLSPEEAAARIDAQPSAELKRAHADVVIANDGSLDDLRRQVLQAWDKIPQA